jgi:hypothetical protein
MTHGRQLREVDGDDPIVRERETLADDDTDDGKLRLRIRKLELPVRPRGVLAE